MCIKLGEDRLAYYLRSVCFRSGKNSVLAEENSGVRRNVFVALKRQRDVARTESKCYSKIVRSWCVIRAVRNHLNPFICVYKNTINLYNSVIAIINLYSEASRENI